MAAAFLAIAMLLAVLIVLFWPVFLFGLIFGR